MTTKKLSYAEQVRQRMNERAQAAANKQSGTLGNSNEFTIKEGITAVRLLPPQNPEDIFYQTHSYHFLEGMGEEQKGIYVFSRKKYTVNGKEFACPIDEAVREMYKSKEEFIKKIAQSAKRKRHFYANALLINANLEEDESPLKILKDTTNQGKLINKICMLMGIPFFKDTEDDWVDKNSLTQDPDAEYYDLLDLTEGRDLKINREKSGVNPWDISFDRTIPLKPRTLTKEEMQLASQVPDLKTIVSYEEDYDKVKNLFDEFLDLKMTGTSPKTGNLTVVSPKTKPSAAKRVVEETDDEDIDLDELRAMI